MAPQVACKACDGFNPGKRVHRLFLGWRNAKDAGKSNKDGHVPATPHVEVCSSCVNRIPERSRRKTMGTLGDARGRLYFLEQYDWDEGGTIGFHNSDYYAVPGSVFYLSAKDASRFLRNAVRAVRKADAERTRRLKRTNRRRT